VKPRDAIAYHTQTIYTPRKGGSIGKHENCSKSKVDGNLISDHLLFLRRKASTEKKKKDPGFTPTLDII
jgi:hypothetical protein